MYPKCLSRNICGFESLIDTYPDSNPLTVLTHKSKKTVILTVGSFKNLRLRLFIWLLNVYDSEIVK